MAIECGRISQKTNNIMEQNGNHNFESLGMSLSIQKALK